MLRGRAASTPAAGGRRRKGNREPEQEKGAEHPAHPADTGTPCPDEPHSCIISGISGADPNVPPIVAEHSIIIWSDYI
jgi:hypothetical protein